MTGEIRIAIVGIGDYAGSRVQTHEYCRRHDRTQAAGLIHPKLGGYRIETIQVVATLARLFDGGMA